MTQENRERIWQVIRQIPAGHVASYGQIARLAGLPGAARLVGNVLRNLPKDSKLPWHRVINSQGKISFPANSPAYLKQQSLLLAEGIIFRKHSLSLTKYGWKP